RPGDRSCRTPCRRLAALHRYLRELPSIENGLSFIADAKLLNRFRGRVVGRDVTRASSVVIDVLAKHDGHAVDIPHTEFTNPVRLIRRPRVDERTTADDFSVVG